MKHICVKCGKTFEGPVPPPEIGESLMCPECAEGLGLPTAFEDMLQKQFDFAPDDRKKHRAEMREAIREDWDKIMSHYNKARDLRIYWFDRLGTRGSNVSFPSSDTALPYVTITVCDNYHWFFSPEGRRSVRRTLVHEAIHAFEYLHHDSYGHKLGYYTGMKDTYTPQRVREIFG